MNRRLSPSPVNDVAADLRNISGALRLLFLLGLGVVALFLVFWSDSVCDHPFTEQGPTEICQTVLLAVSTIFFFLEARRRPDMRGALILAGGFFGCMLIREQDYYFDMVAHGCWKWPAVMLALVCLYPAVSSLRNTIANLSAFVRWRYFPVLLTGVIIVLAYSRLFGMGMIWNTLLPDAEARKEKNAIEESSELLGYLLICFSALLLKKKKK